MAVVTYVEEFSALVGPFFPTRAVAMPMMEANSPKMA